MGRECLSIATAIMYYTDMNEDTICFEILHSMKHCVRVILSHSTSLDTTKYRHGKTAGVMMWFGCKCIRFDKIQQSLLIYHIHSL